ncbi:hypothetical protein [Acaryochloris marina]|uniref:Uncharacterized protein n=1 Tax=Acaryochloris marina (strain MBIC 11017) TaxID=329726 RepID=A8ZR08_ACAM1|nr:hypothetical protein [Acaryochloris marina]ABW33444.1 hypothetical protein AM1_H0094 [Acaryochloris marina MBIC11017]
MQSPFLQHTRHYAHKYGPQWSAPVLLVILTLCPVFLPLNPGTQIAWLEIMALVWSTALFLHLYQLLNIQTKLGLYLFFSGMIALVPSMVKAQNVGNAPSSACNSGFFLIGPMLGAVDTSLGWFLGGVLAYSLCAFMIALMIVFFLVVIVGLVMAGAESHNSKRTLFEVLSQYLNVIITMMVIASLVTVFNLQLSNNGNAAPIPVGGQNQPQGATSVLN